MSYPVIYYEALDNSHIVIGFVLPDGRRFSVDLRAETEDKRKILGRCETEILAYGTIAGQTAN